MQIMKAGKSTDIKLKEIFMNIIFRLLQAEMHPARDKKQKHSAFKIMANVKHFLYTIETK